MIPQAYINEWRQKVPWQSNEQVEQDLVICRSLVELFSDERLADKLAFRGGTALHKLYLSPQPRYSEDIDLVQVESEPIKSTVVGLQRALSFLGASTVEQRTHSTRILCRFDSEFPPVVRLRLKVETNTREHYTVLGLERFPFEVNSPWFKGDCRITTYKIEELLATKLRALYQRKKGRDLYDLYIALTHKADLDLKAILHCYRQYMKDTVTRLPGQREFISNLQAKMHDPEFLGDTTALLRPELTFDPNEAFEVVKARLIEKI